MAEAKNRRRKEETRRSRGKTGAVRLTGSVANVRRRASFYIYRKHGGQTETVVCGVQTRNRLSFKVQIKLVSKDLTFRKETGSYLPVSYLPVS